MSSNHKKERKYANFFEGGTNELKEKFVSQEWLKTYGISNGYNEKTLSLVDDQWPDCEIKTNAYKLCGIEVTELVDQNCIQLNEKGEYVYRTWSEKDIIEAIENRLINKNNMSHGGKYKKLIVLIHTDEFEIQYNKYNALIEKYCFNQMENIDEAYILYSYDSNHKKYPVSVIKFRA